jgi:hypothetical protein
MRVVRRQRILPLRFRGEWRVDVMTQLFDCAAM